MSFYISDYDVKRRHRPAPQTHNKLQSKQRQLLYKTGATIGYNDDESAEETTTMLDLYELPVSLSATLKFAPNSRWRSSFKMADIQKIEQ